MTFTTIYHGTQTYINLQSAIRRSLQQQRQLFAVNKYVKRYKTDLVIILELWSMHVTVSVRIMRKVTGTHVSSGVI